MWSEISRLSHNFIPYDYKQTNNFIPSPHYSLFVTSIFILVHTYTTESLIRGQLCNVLV